MVRISSSVVRSAANRSAWRGREPAVAADVEVPALLGGDDAEVLAPGLGALAGAAGHGRLELVRRAQPPVAQLQRRWPGPTESCTPYRHQVEPTQDFTVRSALP